MSRLYSTFCSNLSIFLFCYFAVFFSRFYGTNCENEDFCITLDPCENSASCVTEVGAYSCDCANGFEGRNCSTELFCITQDVECENGGTCNNLEGELKVLQKLLWYCIQIEPIVMKEMTEIIINTWNQQHCIWIWYCQKCTHAISSPDT